MKEHKVKDVEVWDRPDHSRPKCRTYPLTYGRSGGCYCQPLPLQLLYLSHAIHQETVSVLYGQNKISVTCEKQPMLDHLSPLRTLSLHAWANIQILHIELTAALHNIRHLHVPKFEVIDRRDSTGSEILTRWTAICAFIAPRIAPFQLRLSVLCAASDLETAVDLMESMRQLPPLNKCSVHFGNSHGNKALQSLAGSSSLILTKWGGEHSGSSQSCGKYLPAEVRLQILKETDLVRRPNWASDGNIDIETGSLVRSMSMCCQQCTEVSTFCFCPARNAAFSDTCVCSPVPTALFQVSRMFNLEATEIFFSKNVFRFSGNFPATTQFLAALPTRAIGNIRVIELHLDFERLYSGLGKPRNEDAREWHDLIALLRDRLILSKVWLSILAVDGDTEESMVSLIDDGDNDYSWLHTTSFQLLKPLEQLKGLKKFHVSLCWSTDFESVVEKAVMGPEYDSTAEGKPTYRFSPALEDVLRMPMVEPLAMKST